MLYFESSKKMKKIEKNHFFIFLISFFYIERLMKIKDEFQIMIVEMSSLNEQMVTKFPDI